MLECFRVMLHYWVEECLEFFFSSVLPIEVCRDTWLCFTFQPYVLPLKFLAVVRKQISQLEPGSRCCFLYWREGVVPAPVFVMVHYLFNYTAAAAAKSFQSCPTLQSQRRQPTRLPCRWDSLARTLERVAISFSNAWKLKVKVKSLSRVNYTGSSQTF